MKEYTKYAVDRAVQLLAIDSPTGYTKEAAAWTKSAFEELGFEAKYTNTGGVIADLGGEIAEDALLLEAHADTLGGMVAEVNIDGKRVVLCQPQTFMNLSGECVIQLLNWYKCPLENLLVIYDDIDLPLAKLRVRKNGSAGTHNGMRSILSHVPGQNFPRIRVGVGAKPQGWDLADWVLSHYQIREEQDAMKDAFTRAADCVEDWIKNGIEHAMQGYNKN